MNAAAQFRALPEGNDSELLYAALNVSHAGFAILEQGRVLYRNAAFAETLPVNAGDAIESAVLHSADGLLRQSASTAFEFEGRSLAVISTVPPSEDRPAPQVSELMVAGIAHDFNNLLTGLRLYCDLLLTELKVRSRAYGHGLRIRKTIEGCKALVKQLLAVARMAKIPPEMLSWNEVISATQSFLILLSGGRIEIFNELTPDLPPVRLDPVSARRILLNLVLNARDAMPRGGNVRLSTRYTRESVELTVADHGSGIDPATRSRLFEPFFTTKGSKAGIGLGLYTVRTLVEQNGGALVVESAAEVGTQVTVRLPRAAPVRSRRKASAPSGNKNRKPRQSILKPKGQS